jgi:hypothetical protein
LLSILSTIHLATNSKSIYEKLFHYNKKANLRLLRRNIIGPPPFFNKVYIQQPQQQIGRKKNKNVQQQILT